MYIALSKFIFVLLIFLWLECCKFYRFMYIKLLTNQFVNLTTGKKNMGKSAVHNRDRCVI